MSVGSVPHVELDQTYNPAESQIGWQFTSPAHVILSSPISHSEHSFLVGVYMNECRLIQNSAIFPPAKTGQYAVL